MTFSAVWPKVRLFFILFLIFLMSFSQKNSNHVVSRVTWIQRPHFNVIMFTKNLFLNTVTFVFSGWLWAGGGHYSVLYEARPSLRETRVQWGWSRHINLSDGEADVDTLELKMGLEKMLRSLSGNSSWARQGGVSRGWGWRWALGAVLGPSGTMKVSRKLQTRNHCKEKCA